MANKLFVIGIDKYLKQEELKNSVKDVKDIKSILLEKYDFFEEDVYEVFDEHATSKNIQDAFRRYIKILTEDDNLIVIFSGHGDYDKETDTGFWVPYDANDYTDFIPNQTLTNYLEKIKAKHIFVITDSCFSNSILLTTRTKAAKEFFEKKSRWALASAFNESKDSDGISNTLFTEKIIDFLELTDKDFRVSELIEYVKDGFEINIFQQPQGAPLQIQGHEGGEFVFKIRQHLDKRKFNGYIGFEKILKYYKRNSKFNNIKSYEDRTNKVGYHLFQEVDTVIKKSTFYLYIYDGAIQIKTYNYLKVEHPEIFKDKNLIIFISAEKEQKNREIKRKNINDKFKPLNIFYVDEFIRDHCTPQIIFEDDSKFLNISNFIPPVIDNESNEIVVQDYFKNWFERTDEPIFVIKGSGGIGKTTLAQSLADSLLSDYPNYYVLFIDSIHIKDSLLKNKNLDRLSLYSFYEALYEITDNIQEKLSEELFIMNIDAGNILIIIDGLDEVISKIPNFSVSDFIKSIKKSTSELGNGKVIISCRTYFWDKTDYSDELFTVIELEPFNEQQAKEFFQKSFVGQNRKVEKAIKFANDFKYPGAVKGNIYHPYVLDIIRSIIENEKDEDNLSLAELDSKYLSKNIRNDYITFRVCERERIRVGQINVDEQVSFFIHLSINKRGIIRLSDLKNEIENSLEKTIDNINVEAFKSHPFLKHIDSSITFRYDFLADLFKGLYMSAFFSYKDEISVPKIFVEILNESCWFGSPINHEIVNRIEHWNDDDLLLISDVILQIREYDELKKEHRNRAIANLFNLCLTINHKFKSNSISLNSSLLKALFETSKNVIQNLQLLNINSDQNIKFDFSDLSINKSSINNYNSFWKCNFSKNTMFIECTLLNINFNENNTPLTKDNFINCTFDSSMEKSIKFVEIDKQNQTENLKIFLNQFFHLFLSNGRLGRQWEHKVIAPRYNGINKHNIDYKKLIKILKRNQIIESSEELGKTKLFINDASKETVTKFIKDGTMSNSIMSIITELKK